MLEVRLVDGQEMGCVPIAREAIPARRKKLLDAGYRFVGAQASRAVKGRYEVRFRTEPEPVPIDPKPLPARTAREERIADALAQGVVNAGIRAERLATYGKRSTKKAPVVVEPPRPGKVYSAGHNEEKAIRDAAKAAKMALDFGESSAELLAADLAGRRLDARTLSPEISQSEGEPQIAKAVREQSRRIQDGTYTVVQPDGNYRTIKFQTMTDGDLAGKTIVKFLSGPDNSSDFTGCAFYDQEHGRCVIWKRFRESDFAQDILEAVGVVLVDPQDAGEAYAMRSGRCCRCGRKLTVPASLHRGMGPKCSQGGRD